MPSNPPPIDPWLWPTTPVPLERTAIQVEVLRYHPGQTGSANIFEEMTSLRVLTVHQQLGTDPGTCTLRYAFDGTNSQSPQSVQDALSTSSTLNQAVEIGDQIVIRVTRPDGAQDFLFWGYPVRFSMQMAGDQEVVAITCRGIARKMWESPVGGAIMRSPYYADKSSGNFDVDTDIVWQANPHGNANALAKTLNGASLWTDNGSGRSETYPVVIDPNASKATSSQQAISTVRTSFTLASLVAGLIFQNNTTDQYVSNPDPTLLANTLVTREPIAGKALDVTNPATYTAKDIVVRDMPLTGRDWPTLVEELIRDYAFGMSFRLIPNLRSDVTLPKCQLDIFAQQSGDKRSVYLQPRGSSLDSNLTNVGTAEISRDLDHAVNQWTVIGRRARYEASFVLAPAFAMQKVDGSTITNINQYDTNNPQFANFSSFYRVFILDECGEGYYLNGTNTLTNNGPTDISSVIGLDSSGFQIPFAKNRRKPLEDLITVDADGKAMKFVVSVSTDYGTVNGGQPYPAVWNGKGTWQDVTTGGYVLLPDRLGIRITTANPNNWKIGHSNQSGAPFSSGTVRLVEALSGFLNPSNGQPNYPPVFIRLTCSFEGDTCVKATAPRRDTSPISETISRTIDARDRYQLNTITKSSNLNTTGKLIVSRDDTANCLSVAEAARLASECGLLEGTITIPRITKYYKIGDRITDINGRGLGLQTSQTGGSNDITYPIVTGIRWDFAPKQKTTLTISDESQARHRLERKIQRGTGHI